MHERLIRSLHMPMDQPSITVASINYYTVIMFDYKIEINQEHTTKRTLLVFLLFSLHDNF